MCGFIGFFGCDKNINIEGALNSIKHRGPDDFGIKRGPDWCVGFRRLSIIDLSPKGMQPFENDTCIVYLNGEVYNYIELKKEHKDFFAKTKSDVEILPFLYKTYGIRFLKKINGMFSMVLIDKNTRKKFLIKDRFGKKPLFYKIENQNIIFGSEPKAINKICNLIPDPANILINLSCWGLPPPLSLFKGLKSIIPGTYLEISGDFSTKEVRWYSPTPRHESSETDRLSFFQIFENSLELRTRADVPVCVFLSGGLDSMLIAALLKKKNINFTALTAEIPGKADWDCNTDVVLPKRFCDENNISSLTATVDYSFWNKNIIALTANYDEIFVDSGNLVFYALAKLARNHGFKVALSGVGGDELFGGYPWQKRLLKYGRWAGASIDNCSKIEEKFENVLRYLPRKVLKEKILRLLQLGLFPGLSQLTSLGGGFPEDILQSKSGAAQKLKYIAKKEFNYQSLPAWMDWENKVNLLNFRNIIPFQNYKIDMGCMRYSVENRSPLLDYRLVEMMINVRHKSKVACGPKSLLRDWGRGILPCYVLEGKKSGPTMPIHLWLQGKNLYRSVNFIKKSRTTLGDFFGGPFSDYWCGESVQWSDKNMALRLFCFISLIIWLKINVTRELKELKTSFEEIAPSA